MKELETTGFWAVPKAVGYNKNLSHTAKLVYGILWTRKNGDNESFPSQGYLARHLSISEKYVRDCIKELVNEGLIEVIRRGSMKTNFYHIFLPKIKYTKTDRNYSSTH